MRYWRYVERNSPEKQTPPLPFSLPVTRELTAELQPTVKPKEVEKFKAFTVKWRQANNKVGATLTPVEKENIMDLFTFQQALADINI